MPSQSRLYELIWKRMVASQMAAALFENTTVDIEAKDHQDYLLRTAASINTFPGFITLYSEGRDEDEEEEKSTLPPLEKGDAIKSPRPVPGAAFYAAASPLYGSNAR